MSHHICTSGLHLLPLEAISSVHPLVLLQKSNLLVKGDLSCSYSLEGVCESGGQHIRTYTCTNGTTLWLTHALPQESFQRAIYWSSSIVEPQQRSVAQKVCFSLMHLQSFFSKFSPKNLPLLHHPHHVLYNICCRDLFDTWLMCTQTPPE